MCVCMFWELGDNNFNPLPNIKSQIFDGGHFEAQREGVGSSGHLLNLHSFGYIGYNYASDHFTKKTKTVFNC